VPERKKNVAIPGLELKLNVLDDTGDVIKKLRLEKDWEGVGSSTTTRKRLHFGYHYNTSISDPLTKSSPLPEYLKDYLKLAEENAKCHFHECLVNEYLPGQGISAHIDKTDVFGHTVACFSLGSSAVIRFRHHDGRVVEVNVPDRSLYIMKG